MKIGFSLSFCIRDICEGKVKSEDVLYICTGCAPRDDRDIAELLNEYCKTYWRKCPDRARSVFVELRQEHRIGWLSSFEKNSCNIGWGHWLDIPNYH